MLETLLSRPAACLPAGSSQSNQRDLITFDSGHALPSIFPDLREFANTALADCRSETLQYAPRPGIPDLREWIASFVSENGKRFSSSEICVVTGAKQGIELVCKLLLDEGDWIVVTVPTYFTAIPIFRSSGAKILEVRQDAEGMDTEDLEVLLQRHAAAGHRPPKFIYNVPDFHNPTGLTMSLRRREELLRIARQAGIYIVEDSPYKKVRFEGTSLPSLKSLDTGHGVFGIGTFSKLLAPGLRVGWITTSPEAISRLSLLKADGGTCPLTQRIIFEFCRAGNLEAHIKLVCKSYRANRDKMLQELAKAMPEISISKPEGGYYLWLRLPDNVDGDLLAEQARKEGVVVLPGSSFLANKDKGHSQNFIRLAFSHASFDEIEIGVSRLAQAYRSITDGQPKSQVTTPVRKAET